MRLIWRVIRWPFLALALYLGGILLYGTLTDWQPDERETVLASNGQTARLPYLPDSIITLTTWNVGHGGMGAEDFSSHHWSDFLWTESGNIRAGRDNVERYVEGQRLTINSTQSDFFLLQEVDTASRRSYFINQLAVARDAQPEYATYYAANYRHGGVPLPLLKPWNYRGAVSSGIATLAKYRPTESQRLQLPAEESWPAHLFQPDNCLLRQVYSTRVGRQLALYNLHLSPYDENNGVRREQLNFLRGLILADYEEGRYVIVGGDWNQLPPGFNWFSLNPTVEETQLSPGIPFDFLPGGWNWVYDPAVASVRKSDTPYDAHRSEKSVTDLFLISPNVRIRAIKALDQGFRFSDHQPVYLRAELIR